MIDIRMQRDFNVSPARLFRAITQSAELTAWWGPETMTLAEGELDFTRTGPWYAVIVGSDGARYKMSGQVTHVEPPRSVGYTWAWHDDADARGPESFVTLTVSETKTGSRLSVDHRGLPDDEIGRSHEEGWTSSINSLAAHLA